MRNEKGVTLIEILAVFALSIMLVSILFGINTMIQNGFQDTSQRYYDDSEYRKANELLTIKLAEVKSLKLLQNQVQFQIYDPNNPSNLIWKKIEIENSILYLSSLNDDSDKKKIAENISLLTYRDLNGDEIDVDSDGVAITSGAIYLDLVFHYTDFDKTLVLPIKILEDNK